MDNIKRISEKIINFSLIIPIGFGVCCVQLVAAILCLLIRGHEGMEPTWMFSVGADLFCIAVCVMLCLSCTMNYKNRNEHTRVFVALLTTDAIALFLDESAWLVQGIPHLRYLNIIINVLFYMNALILIYEFWQYLRRVLKMDDYLIQPVNTILTLLLIPMMLLCIVNFFYPLYFNVDANGVYSRADNWYISQLYMIIALLIVVMQLIMSHVPLKDRLVAFSFAAIPSVNHILTSHIFGISTQYASTLVSIVLIYGVLFAKHEKAINNTEMELDVATRIQSNMLPNDFPYLPERTEFDLYASMTSAKEVGGDFYDFFMVDDTHLALVIADVSGKGIPAALFMMSTKILIKNTVMTGKSPGEALQTINNLICENNHVEMFVTVWLGILNLNDGSLVYANAGHEYPLIKSPTGDFELVKAKHSFVVGGLPGMKYRETSMTLQPGTKLFLYTDGLPEAENSNGNQYGFDRFTTVLNREKKNTPHELLNAVSADVRNYMQDHPQFDDLTMLCIHYLGREAIMKELTIDAAVENIDTVTTFITGELEKLDCPLKAENQIAIAIDELFGNIARYAYSPDIGKATVRFEVEREPLSVIITFIDKGVPFNPLEQADPNTRATAEERQIGGLGIFLVKKTMTMVEYEFKDGQNILKIKKNLA